MNHRILLVDDEPNLLESLSRVLRKDYQIDVANGGESALLGIVTGSPVSVIVTDLNMPGMDGITLLKKVAEVSPATVRIMLSGVRDFDASIRAVNEGNVFRFLTKPFPSKTLQEVLKSAIDQYEINREALDNSRFRDQASKTIPACAYCSKVRKPDKDPLDPASWDGIERFLAREFGFRFSHGICPHCIEKLYSEFKKVQIEEGISPSPPKK